MTFEPPNRGVSLESPAPAATPAASTAQRQAATIRYLDRPEIAETFADSVAGVVFDGQTLRLEFAVTRLDEVKPNAPITGRRYPDMPHRAAADRGNRSDQSHAADRDRARTSRRDQDGNATRRGDVSGAIPAPPFLDFAALPAAVEISDKLDIKVSLYLYCRGAGALL